MSGTMEQWAVKAMADSDGYAPMFPWVSGTEALLVARQQDENFNAALLRERRLSTEVAGWKQELRDLADAIPTDNSWGDSALMRAVAQAQLVLQEGLQ